MKSAVRLYKRALKLCEKYNLPTEAAAIHCNLARLYLEIKEYNSAYKHCEVSIDKRLDNPKVCAQLWILYSVLSASALDQCVHVFILLI
jgi:tetratricopeptide (TPR) repeat protein